jgi:uncharacterized membrane protein YfcA
MDGIGLTFFLLAGFLGGITTGIAGFAFGLVVSGVWLHLLTPAQTAILIVGYAFVTQSYSIWKLRHALDWRRIAPFIVGGAFGVSAGALLLPYIAPDHLRIGVGLLLVLYSLYSLTRPAIGPVQGSLAADLAIGFFNGLLGPLTGLAGIIVTVWCQMRGWPKDQQRAVFQPALFAAMVMTGISLALAGAVTGEIVRLYLYGLPAVGAGLWLGFKLYGRLDDAAFRKIVLVLLTVSGFLLVVPRLLVLAG